MSDDDYATAWVANHFSQANPAGPGQDDVPALLRRVAETIAGLGEVRIIDLVMHNQPELGPRRRLLMAMSSDSRSVLRRPGEMRL
jgi:hypothetical protein